MKWKQWIWPGLMFFGPSVLALAIQLTAKNALSTPLGANLANSFLATIAQVLAGMLAIVFSVSVLAIEITSDRYTPRLFSYFIGYPATWLTLISYLSCILVSVIAIGVQGIPMFQWEFLAMVWLFVFCLMALPYYFRQTLQLLDPRNLAGRIRDEGLRAIERQNKQKTSEVITSLGDVAIKAFERGEEDITKGYLDALDKMQRALVAPDVALQVEDVSSVTSAIFGFGIPSPVVDQYLRIFKVVVVKNSQDLSLSVADRLGEAIVFIMQQVDQGNNEENLKGVLQQYQAFAEIAIENRDVSRFKLARSLRDLILNQAQTKTGNGGSLSPCLTALEHTNRMIIDHEDSELWKEQLDYFSVASVDQISTSLPSDLMALLRELHHTIAITREKEQLWYSIAWPMITRITPTNKRVFELGMSEIGQLIQPSEQRLEEQVRRLRDTIRVLWITTGVYDVFFRTCVYAFYRRKLGYIKELWRHVNPPDASASWGNANLIHLNVGFLTHQMFYHTLVDWPIEGYHGGEMYVLQYYLLCLAYALQRPNHNWHPLIPPINRALLCQGDEYSVAIGQELGAVHAFLVNLPHCANKVLKQHEAVAAVSEEWDDVLDGRTRDALEQAREWLKDTERRQEWKEKAESIIRNLPLDTSRIEAYKKAALEHYQSESRIDQLATTEPLGAKAPTELRGSCRIQHPEKRDFTLIGLGTPQGIGFEAVYQIVRAEVAHITKIILEHEATDHIGLKQLTFNEIGKAVRKIDAAGYKATILLEPGQRISSAWQDDPDFRTRLAYEGNDRYLMLNDSARLRILESDGNCAFVLDSSAGNWTAVEPLEIEVAECARDPLAVQITAQEVVDYQVLNPGAVEILKFG
jgi:hypothetical protein